MGKRRLFSQPRRTVLKSAGFLGGLFTLRQAQAHHTETHMERAMEIEPTFKAWEAPVLSLNYTRLYRNDSSAMQAQCRFTCAA